MAEGYVYIMASCKGGKLYTGATTDLVRRIDEHRRGVYDCYTRQHGIKTLVYYERHDNIEEAIVRERQIKGWYRQWKVKLIEKDNPEWAELGLNGGWDIVLGGLVQ